MNLPVFGKANALGLQETSLAEDFLSLPLPAEASQRTIRRDAAMTRNARHLDKRLVHASLEWRYLFHVSKTGYTTERRLDRLLDLVPKTVFRLVHFILTL